MTSHPWIFSHLQGCYVSICFYSHPYIWKSPKCAPKSPSLLGLCSPPSFITNYMLMTLKFMSAFQISHLSSRPICPNVYLLFPWGCLTGISDVTWPNLNSGTEHKYSLPPCTFLLTLKSWRVRDHNFPRAISYQCLLMLLYKPLYCLLSPSSVPPPKPKPCFLFLPASSNSTTKLPEWCVNVGQFMAFLVFFQSPHFGSSIRPSPLCSQHYMVGRCPADNQSFYPLPLLTRIQ